MQLFPLYFMNFLDKTLLVQLFYTYEKSCVYTQLSNKCYELIFT